jgi:hypothetical protein
MLCLFRIKKPESVRTAALPPEYFPKEIVPSSYDLFREIEDAESVFASGLPVEEPVLLIRQSELMR